MRHLVSSALCAIVLLASSGCVAIVKKVEGPAGPAQKQAVVLDGNVYVLDLKDHTYYQVAPRLLNDPAKVRFEAAEVEFEIED